MAESSTCNITAETCAHLDLFIPTALRRTARADDGNEQSYPQVARKLRSSMKATHGDLVDRFRPCIGKHLPKFNNGLVDVGIILADAGQTPRSLPKLAGLTQSLVDVGQNLAPIDQCGLKLVECWPDSARNGRIWAEYRIAGNV